MINIFIKRIKDLREDKDKTQKEIAEYLGITQQQYSLYEKGNRTIPVDFLIMLSKYYKVSTDYILGLTDIKQPYTRIKNNININFGNVEMKWGIKMENFKSILTSNKKSAKCEIEQEYDFENNEITFTGKIKFTKMTKTNTRIMYATKGTASPAVLYFFDKVPLRVTNVETLEKYEELEEENNTQLI